MLLLGGRNAATYDSLLIANMLYNETLVRSPQSREPMKRTIVRKSADTLFQLMSRALKPRKIPRYFMALKN